MLVPLEGYQQAWRQIKQESLSHSTYRLVIFVSCMDVDAFAAAMMLGALLKKHLILYKTEPVVGYESLKRGFERLDPSIRNVFLVGCGSNIDLDEFLKLDVSTSQPAPKIHIFDRRRPWNLNNLYGSVSIYCYDDGSADQLEPYRDAYMYLATQPEESGHDEDDENEEEHTQSEKDDEDENGNKDSDSYEQENEARPKRSKKYIDSDDEEGTQEDQEQADESTATKTSVSKRRKTLASQNTRLLEEYYEQGAHITSTSAISVYTLLTLIGESSSRMLWLAVIGATSIEPQYPQLYRLLLPSLKDEMRRLNQTEANHHQEGSAASSRRIRFNSEHDYSLFLLRQWSLYESMVHSSYVSAKLYLWREDGRKKLHKMLARVGITLQDAKESWVHTKPQLKRELKSKLDSISGYYGIEGITRDGVVRQYGLTGSMSAGDCVESIAAYLETGKATRELSANDNENENSVTAVSDLWVRNFWTAWDAIDNHDRLRQGAEQAKILQKAVVATANFIFEKNLPKDLHSFRMVIVQEAPEIAVFLNPLSLQRLAVWISESLAEIHTTNIPLVLAVLNEAQNVYLVFGIAGHRSREQSEEGQADLPFTQTNFFGRQFQETALAINARIRVDAFESSIIEVAREDLPRFLEALDYQIRK